MKFYIASSFRNIDNVREVADKLKSRGFRQTYDWTMQAPTTTLQELAEIGQNEMRAVLEADVFIIMLPAGKGSHVEMGLALGAKKTILLYSPTSELNDIEKTSTFYQLPEVHRIMGSIEDLVSHL
ncbi:nucleoside 2-deoxyribosyltransferase [Paenibacillus qinlingensis]|uniref:Nucleoside 2-deoxyribosyltransferase n=1 Tax=Paenibacillus qinlingensis TaxID=1837343 RepID=A0ABU1NQX9_9BACL|nr:nucleoside 2-deoxyribosyltransferase [Paenibacillus qinlingensis]MDR6549879.1 nucleoside 2-deoxyribosyltransferase [Paenibacillus qinlingensis]